MTPDGGGGGCLSELDLLVFMDGERSAEESRAARAHLGRCFECNRAYEALRRESEVIRAGVALVPAASTAAGRPPQRELGWVVAAGFALSLGLVVFRRLYAAVSDASAGTPLPDALPFLSNLGYTLLSLLDLRQVGTQLAIGGTLIMALIAIAAASAAFRRSRSGAAPALLLAALLPGLSFLAAPAEAVEVLRGESCEVAADRVIRDDVFVMCERDATIAGTIEGDLYFLSQSLTITGRVDGDVIGASERLEIPGRVDLSVRALVQTLEVGGSVGRGLASAGQRITVLEGGSVGGSLFAAAERLTVSGAVGRDLRAAAVNTALNAPVGGQVRVRGAEFTAGPEARITGSARFTGPNAPDRHARASQVDWNRPAEEGPDPWGTAGRVAARWAMGFVFGLALVLLMPGALGGITAVGGRPLVPVLFGMLLFVGLPFTAVLLFVTIVGLPLAGLTLALWLFLLYAARVAAAMVVGQAILGLGASTGERVLRLALGMLVLAVVFELPVAGGIAALLTMFFGLGSFGVWVWRNRRGAGTPTVSGKAPPAPAPPAPPTPPAPPAVAGPAGPA